MTSLRPVALGRSQALVNAMTDTLPVFDEPRLCKVEVSTSTDNRERVIG
jgi:hypothetical protein